MDDEFRGTSGQAAACEQARTWLSARRDAEAADDPEARLHVEQCDACTRWNGTLDDVTRRARVRSGGAPDVLAPALAAWPAPAGTGPLPGPASPLAHGEPSPTDLPPDRALQPVAARQVRVARSTLAVAGIAGLVLAGLGLLDVFGYVEQAGLHLGWELYSFEAALAVGFLLVARSPQRYLAGLLPVTAAVALLSLVPSAGVLATNGADVLREVSHMPLLVGLGALLLLADAEHRQRVRARRGGPRPAVA